MSQNPAFITLKYSDTKLQMEDYRARHHAQYLERIEKIEKLEKLVKSVETLTSMMMIRGTVKKMAQILEDDTIDKQKLGTIGLSLVEAINTNTNISVDFNNQIQVNASQEVQRLVKTVLKICGVDDDIEVQYTMDCSRDEELARELAQTVDPVPPVARRLGGRPRKVPITRE